jgi:hypothetical protein
MIPQKPSRLDALRGAIAGSRAVAMGAAARALFEAGGRRVLPLTLQRAVRGAVEREASLALSAIGVAARAIETSPAPMMAVRGARAASRQLVRGVAGAAAAGAVLDGGWALFKSMKKVRTGEMTRQQAAAHVAREAGSGAAATAAGTAAAALLIAITGGVATPAVFVVAAAASIGAKAGLDAWLRRTHGPAERAHDHDGSHASLGPGQGSATG